MQEQQMKMQEMQMQAQQMELQRYEQEAPLREEKAISEKIQRLAQDSDAISKIVANRSVNLDPNLPPEEFEKQAVNMAVGIEEYLVKSGIPEDRAYQEVMDMKQRGMFEPDFIRAKRVEMGIDKEPGEPVLRSVGGSLVEVKDDRSVDVLYTAPEKPAPSTTVNVNTADSLTNLAEKEANKAYGGKIGDNVNKRFSMAEEAYSQNSQLDTVALALAEGANTGYGEEVLLNIRSLAQTVGIDTGDLGPAELIRKVSNEMALRLRNPDSGLGLTGNTSNKDLDFLKASVIGLARTESGNKAIINIMRKYNRMKIDIAQKQDEIIAENGGSIPMNIDRQMLKFANEYDLFSDEERKEIEGFLKDGKTDKGPKTADEYLKSIGVQ
jgi:chaperonin cofactor prefoldin